LLQDARVRAFVIAIVITPACMPVPVYKVQRSARVPHAAAPLDSGAPMPGPVELSVGASNTLDTRTPRLATPTASVETPSQQVRGELRIRALTYGQIALIHEQGIAGTYQPLDKTQAPIDSGTAWSLGLAARYAIHIDEVPELSLALGVEVLSWTIPYVEYRTCVENCDGVVKNQVSRGTDTVGVLAYSVTPTYRSGPLAVFAGMYATKHPTIVRKGTEYSATDYDSDIDSGHYNVILHAGAQYTFGPISVLAQVQQDVTRSPVWYGPSFGFALAAHLPDWHDHARHLHVISPAPPPPPPGPPVEPDDRPW
jgi:hypothetical protein